MVAQTVNWSIQEAEADRALLLPGQPELHCKSGIYTKILSPKKKSALAVKQTYRLVLYST